MSILLDTNILLRLADEGSPSHAEALAAVEVLEMSDRECVIVPQVLYEYWVVATRPMANNGLGMSINAVNRAVDRWTTAFRLLLDERGVFTRWYSLVTSHEVKGKAAHDARLVAAMQRHRVMNVLTFNQPDFIRFTSIKVFTPTEILAGRLPS